MSDDEREEATKQILSVINIYNQDKEGGDQIKFIHGGSSARLAIVGKDTAFINYKTKETIKAHIPLAIFPDGILRKKYGIHPLSGERGPGTFGNGSRKIGINYTHVSGMPITEEGIEVVLTYATLKKSHIHHEILSCIYSIDPEHYILSLKKLVMYAANLSIVNPTSASKNADNYMGLCKNEYLNLTKRAPTDPKIKIYFEKYLPRIENILKGKEIKFDTTLSFQEEIKNQYPIIFCSTAKSQDFSSGILGEIIHAGELPLNTVKIMVTLPEYVSTLKKKIKTLELKIDVFGYIPSIKYNEDTSLQKLNHVKSLSELMKIIPTVKHHPDFEEIVISKIILYLKEYMLQNKDEEYFQMACWLLKNTKLDLGEKYIDCQNLYQNIKSKVMADSTYLSTQDRYLNNNPEKQFKRLEKIVYFDALHYFASKDRLSVLNSPYDKSDIPNQLNILMDDEWHNHEKELAMLEKLFTVLNIELVNSKDQREYFSEVIKQIKNKYCELMYTYPEVEKLASCDDLFNYYSKEKSAPSWNSKTRFFSKETREIRIQLSKDMPKGTFSC
jgi:hypothetical protein